MSYTTEIDGGVEQLNLSDVDTYLFDYGGVMSFHYCEPWQGNLSLLLKVEPKRVRELLSETSEQGKGYRLGVMSRENFWDVVMKLAGVNNVSISELEDNWARSYQIDERMLALVDMLQKSGKRVGVMMNTDIFRYEHIEREYGLSSKVDFLISSNLHGIVKPDKEAYLQALRLVGREEMPGKVIYFDDRERNIKPCFEVGMKGMVFTNFESLKKILISQGVILE